MRKIFILLIILLPSTIFSQNKIGVFGGVNYSYFTNGFLKDLNAENKIGIQLGILYELNLSDKISFRPKFIFSQQGDKKSEQVNCNCFNVNLTDHKLNYLNLPLDFKFGEKIYLITGPQIGFLINKKKLSYNSIFSKTNFDFGINIGIGKKINDLFIELGAYQGFTSLFQYRDNEYDGSAKNGLIKLTIGYYM